MDSPLTSSSARHDGTPEASSGAALLLAWVFVGVPLLWGVSQTFIKALDLFR